MTRDRRLTAANERAAHVSLQGIVTAPAYTSGAWARVTAPLVDLLRDPAGGRNRQLLLGDRFLVIDRHKGFAFGQSEKDGYCGYVSTTALGADQSATHWVAAPATHLYPEPRVQAHEIAGLSLGARVNVTGTSGKFVETDQGFIPAMHLREIGDWLSDPVEVAATFVGTPYLWGGNSRGGIDCSGLAQAAHLACGIPCAGDSDLQQSMGNPLAADAPLQRGDLLFWKGHVALVANDRQMIHATGHFMATVFEDTNAGIARIIAQNGGPVIARRRL